MYIAFVLGCLLICDGFVASMEHNSKTGPLEAEALTGQDLVEYINTDQNLWKARLNDKVTLSGKDKDDLLGDSSRDLGRIVQNLADRGNISLPLNFDAREKWPNCQSIWRIDDQSSCGSCWATGAVMAMSDRICIASGGEIQISLSVMDLVACCTNCSENFSKEKGGCFGGNIVPGWQFWNTDGLVTGSDYTTQMGCRPYPFPHCERGVNSSHYPQCKEFNESYPTPSCETTCQDNYKENSYNSDKHYGHPPFVIANDSEAIQKELYTNGPLEVCFDVYEDFEHYTSGIYKHVGGKYRFRHCVRLIGWGEEKGALFWILANTFNSDWGDHGFFRIVRGSNECNIEMAAVGALPDLKRYQASEAGSCRRWITVLAVLTVLTHSLALCVQRYKI